MAYKLFNFPSIYKEISFYPLLKYSHVFALLHDVLCGHDELPYDSNAKARGVLDAFLYGGSMSAIYV